METPWQPTLELRQIRRKAPVALFGDIFNETTELHLQQKWTRMTTPTEDIMVFWDQGRDPDAVREEEWRDIPIVGES